MQKHPQSLETILQLTKVVTQILPFGITQSMQVWEKRKQCNENNVSF